MNILSPVVCLGLIIIDFFQHWKFSSIGPLKYSQLKHKTEMYVELTTEHESSLVGSVIKLSGLKVASLAKLIVSAIISFFRQIGLIK